MDWYYCLGAIVYLIFIVQFVLSFFGADLDFDLDGDLDFGDVISFKGLIHFLMGFSGWFMIRGGEPSRLDWVFATILGLLFFVLLALVYRFMMRLEQPTEEEDLTGKTGEVYLVYGGLCEVTVTVRGQRTQVRVMDKSENGHKKGDQVRLIGKDENGTYYII